MCSVTGPTTSSASALTRRRRDEEAEAVQRCIRVIELPDLVQTRAAAARIDDAQVQRAPERPLERGGRAALLPVAHSYDVLPRHRRVEPAGQRKQ